MQSAVDIFVNGITGVFIGMAVLYLAIKLIALAGTAGSESEKND